ncbi:BTAD domain-containing putative transcriptional regulator [Ilumatobacter sp.]|uniref:BTAD domain-containing putative transcriptional regulator n=1 Tax=Ilumatobacter sp. TaxID=1967498 RepID=UPI003C476282
MSLTIHLLGRPRIESSSGDVYRFRSRKSWALLTFLVLNERQPSRRQLASLLFSEADDPLRALRWNLSEIRRSLGDGGALEGDPVALRLPSDTVVDVALVSTGGWKAAVELPGLGSDLLDGIVLRGAPAFESWLLSEQRHVAAASEAILHEAALGSMSRGDKKAALGYAMSAAMMSPLDENHQALVIRLYRLIGDDVAAEQQFTACTELFDRELGVTPGPVVQAAMLETRDDEETDTDPASVAAIVEAGSAAVAAGAVEAGVQSLRAAVRLADGTSVADLRVSSRLVLAEALVHSLRGFDEEGLAALYEADEIALAHGDRASVAHARAEVGYVDFLRARYDRAERWLTDALDFADNSPSMTAKATTYLGSVESDRANYATAASLLEHAIDLARVAGEPRREAFALSMLGRISLLRNDLDTAADQLDASIGIAQHDHWLALLPWPQTLRGEVQLARHDPDGADALLRQAFARACQLGDPCWEGMSARGLAMVAAVNGETARAFDVLADARTRCNRLADPYVWLDGYILDAQCNLGIRHGHSDTERWLDTMRHLSSRTGMKELTVRSLLHGAALGHDGDAPAAALVAAEIDNPALHNLIEAEE